MALAAALGMECVLAAAAAAVGVEDLGMDRLVPEVAVFDDLAVAGVA